MPTARTLRAPIQGAARQLAKATIESALVWDCMLALERLSEFNKVTLVWVLKHEEIPGNETADILAKKRANEAPSNQARILIKNSRPGRAKELLALNKQKLRVTVGLLTGHSALLRAHLFNLGLAEQKECRLCRDEKEDNDLKSARVTDMINLVLGSGLAPNT
ncbi:Uncharacterized protein DBV15_11858 [Temnothorax longispinosus]|uniref:Uncharacterized protein n=1 Tax=Temnothorax longispinosus TaxID=300112 RepID=A0A4S2KSD2_9HYME|nr:Uncharacterized protein DBV15_11858 [Temnothorax longispinosus]